MAARSTSTKEFFEERLRVTCYLPLSNEKQFDAVSQVFEHLRRLKDRKDEQRLELDGYTSSSELPPVFSGWYWLPPEKTKEENRTETSGGKWVHDQIVVCWMDVSGPAQHWVPALGRLKKRISKIYEEHAQAQAEIWIIVHRATRL